MAVPKPVLEKKYFTVAEANAALPLVRAIVRDITELSRDLRERQERRSSQGGSISEAYDEERHVADAEFERDHERLLGYEQELKNLGVELKDYFTGLVDFPCWMDNREVYLCWRQGEADVAYWHELQAGFAGRQPLNAQASNN